MYERLLDKSNKPDLKNIKIYLGEISFIRLTKFEGYLKKCYQLTKELRFPFGNNYGWGYKYSHKLTHLCYAFFEKEAFTVAIQIGDKFVKELEDIKPLLSDKALELWKNRYPCGKSGGWIHYRILREEDLEDIYKIISIKKKPILK